MTTEFWSAEPEDLVQVAMVETLARQGFQVRRLGHHLDARRGSEARLRFFGALMTPETAFPVAVLVDTESVRGGTKAIVTVSDDFGFGSRAGLRGTYERIGSDVIASLAVAARATGEQEPSRPAPPSARRSVSPGSPSAATRLEELDDLHGRGLISDEEYQTKRHEILDQL